ncbi:endoplasmic reticulum mannosyl-oligosaccharide 1,2-alpha-mannosidase-like [Antedon mediterranea]|uniref:endoplasmic reticulum mannosyl-oligosaccharide 1,2-alpha-mannosidase-like n=1 Tax=Antedon mediterranea TaxID=105859 RepID=UPI003AF9C395
MYGSPQKRDFISFTVTKEDDKTIKRQSCWRVWRRMSRLQKNIISFLLAIGIVLCIYILLHRKASTSGMENAVKAPPWDYGVGEDYVHFENDGQPGKKADRNKEDIANVNHPDTVNEVDQDNNVDEPVIHQPGGDDDEDDGEDEKQNENHKIPIKHQPKYGPQNKKQEAVLAAFQHAWKAYKAYAWGHDELKPVSKSWNEWFNLGLTLIDSLDTMILLGLKKEFLEARDWVANDMNIKPRKDVNLFETTIRVLGGLLSAYHLSDEPVFLEKAILLGNELLPCFGSKSSIPYADVNLMTGVAKAPKWGPDSTVSEVTTIQLEFRDLSFTTGDMRYKEAVDKVSTHIHNLPKANGLVPIFINANNGQFRARSTVTFGARGDSYYEYLLKQWIQTSKSETMFLDDYLNAMNGAKEKLVRTSEPSKLTFIGELLSGERFSAKMDHLACFLPGTLALGYKNGLDEWHLQMAKDLIHTCYQTYARTATKLSPEISHFNMVPGTKGDDIIIKPADAHNLLRPETVESLLYMYRITGDEIYRKWGWEIFQAFEKHTKLPHGYSSIGNVQNVKDPGIRDKMESFFLGETLKYFFLLFSDDENLISFDKYVFNTEAHPLPIRDSQGKIVQ